MAIYKSCGRAFDLRTTKSKFSLWSERDSNLALVDCRPDASSLCAKNCVMLPLTIMHFSLRYMLNILDTFQDSLLHRWHALLRKV